jgi:hypothetical protein
MLYRCYSRTLNKKGILDTLEFDIKAESLADAYVQALANAYSAFKTRLPELEEKDVSVDIRSTNKF